METLRLKSVTSGRWIVQGEGNGGQIRPQKTLAALYNKRRTLTCRAENTCIGSVKNEGFEVSVPGVSCSRPCTSEDVQACGGLSQTRPRIPRLHTKRARLMNLFQISARELSNRKLSNDNISMMSMSLVIPFFPDTSMQGLMANRVLLTGFLAWFAAQFAKIFTKRFKKGVWDLKAMVEPGGMPSSHSSLCAGVTTALALQEGLGSPLFALALAFSVIVMYDAMGVRQHAGKQAAVLNQVVTELWHKNPALLERKLKEVLGHTPRQVLCGGILGFATAMSIPWPAA